MNLHDSHTATDAPDDDQSSSSLSQRAMRGGGWQIAGGVWQAVLRLGASMVLARALAPEAFGVLGMVILVCSLAGQFIVGGIASGMIAKKQLTRDDVHTAFTLVVLLQSVLFVAIYALAPTLESFKQIPGLADALRLGAITLLTAAFAMAPSAQLSRSMRFKTLTAISASSLVVEMALAIALVTVFDYGAMGLVWAFVIGDIISTGLKIVAARWCPHFALQRDSLRYFKRFGSHQAASHGSVYLMVNADQILISVILGAQALGFYLYALRLPNLLYTRLVMPASSVVLPSLGQMGGDGSRIFFGYIKSARYLSLLTFPLLAGVAALADPLVALLWGSNWASAVTPMRFLCAVAAIRTISCCSGSIFLCMDRPDLLMKIALAKLPLTFALIGGFAWAHGLNGAAVGMLLASTLILIDYHFAAKLTGVSSWKLVHALWPATASAAACGLVAWTIQQATHDWALGNVLSLACAVVGGAVVYVAFLRAAFPQTFFEASEMVQTLLGIKTLSMREVAA